MTTKINIAISLVEDIPYEEVYEDIARFLPPIPEGTQLDIFHCSNTTERGITFCENKKQITSKLSNFDSIFKTLTYAYNNVLIKKSSSMIEKYYSHYINSLEMHKSLTYNNYQYGMVIVYDKKITNFNLPVIKHMEPGYMYTNKHQLHFPVAIDWEHFVSSFVDYTKIVQQWKIFPYVTDQTYSIWEFIKEDDISSFMVSKWCNLQSIKLRRYDEF